MSRNIEVVFDDMMSSTDNEPENEISRTSVTETSSSTATTEEPSKTEDSYEDDFQQEVADTREDEKLAEQPVDVRTARCIREESPVAKQDAVFSHNPVHNILTPKE